MASKNDKSKIEASGNYNSDRPMVRKARGQTQTPPKKKPTATRTPKGEEPKHQVAKTRSRNRKPDGTRYNSPSDSPERQRVRREDWVNGKNPSPPTPETRLNGKGPICGRPRHKNSSSGPGVCCNPAGARTPHLGFGPCWLHGGNLPGEVKKGEVYKAEKAVVLFGLPKEIDPHRALLDEVHMTAGHVEWLRTEIIQKLDDPKQLTQITDAGVEPSVWINMYQKERDHLVKVAKAAIDAGVAERQVRLQEEQGRLLAMVIQAFIRDPELDLTPAQLVRAPKLIRKHLLAAPTEIQAAEVPANLQPTPQPAANSDDQITEAELVDE